jgi:hypothetical protein
MKRKTKTKTISIVAQTATAAMGLAALISAHAVENGSPVVPPGVYDFGAGMLPPPTEMGAVGLRVAGARAKQARDGGGNRSPAVPDLEVTSYSLALIKMTNVTLWGAKYGWGAVVPYLDMSLDLTVPTPGGPLVLSGRNRSVGDVSLMPVLLQWVPSPGLFTNFQLAVQAPTGAYDKNRLINAGTNYWSVIPSFGITSISHGGFEVSSNFQVTLNGRNRDPDYRSGSEYQQDFAVGQHIGPWTIGLGGYYHHQLNDDSAPGLLDGNRKRVAALGPAVNFFEAGSGLPAVWAHVYKEFAARNTAQGTHFAVRAAWSF